MPCFFFLFFLMRNFCFFSPWRRNALSKCLSTVCTHRGRGPWAARRRRCAFQAASDQQKLGKRERQDSDKTVLVCYLCRFTVVALDCCPNGSPALHLERPFRLNMANLGSLEPRARRLVPTASLYGIFFTPPSPFWQR